jgi:hypothetical protein
MHIAKGQSENKFTMLQVFSLLLGYWHTSLLDESVSYTDTVSLTVIQVLYAQSCTDVRIYTNSSIPVTGIRFHCVGVRCQIPLAVGLIFIPATFYVHSHSHEKCLLASSCLSFCLLGCLSLYIYKQSSNWLDFCEIWYWGLI